MRCTELDRDVLLNQGRLFCNVLLNAGLSVRSGDAAH